VSVVANSSPLVILAKIDYFDLLQRLFPLVYITPEVHEEVVVCGAGLPGANEVTRAKWIEVRKLKNPSDLTVAHERFALGAGELSTVLLGKEIRADAVLLDDYNARKLARAEGLQVRGTMGLLESFYLRGYLPDLRTAFQQLLSKSYIDGRLVNFRLRAWGLRPL
jgi:uncharacterized protein